MLGFIHTKDLFVINLIIWKLITPWRLGQTSIHLRIEKQGNETNWMRKQSIRLIQNVRNIWTNVVSLTFMLIYNQLLPIRNQLTIILRYPFWWDIFNKFATEFDIKMIVNQEDRIQNKTGETLCKRPIIAFQSCLDTICSLLALEPSNKHNLEETHNISKPVISNHIRFSNLTPG